MKHVDSDGSDASGSFVVHSEGSGSVVVHDIPDASGHSTRFTGSNVGVGAASGYINSEAGVNTGGNRNNLAAMVAGIGRFRRGSGGRASTDTVGKESTGDMEGAENTLNSRRLPRPKPVLRWSQVPLESRLNPAPYLLNRYGRGGGGGAAPSPAVSPGLSATGGVGGLGDSLDAFKLYVADDGEMKMGNHHNDFYEFSYDPADDTDDLVNLQQRQLSTNCGGGDFYEMDDSLCRSSGSEFQHGNSHLPDGKVDYEKSEAKDIMTDRRSWVMDPTLLNKNVSRRRRLTPKRRGGEQMSKKGKGRRQRRRHTHDELAGPVHSRQAMRDSTGNGSTRVLLPFYSNRSLPHTNSPTQRYGGRCRSGTTPQVRQEMVSVRPGAHVAAGAAAYPHLPASLGALVLLTPGNPTTNPLGKLSRLRKLLLQRQLDEQRDYEKRQRARHRLENKQTAATATTAGTLLLNTAGEKMSPPPVGAANSHGDGSSNPHFPHHVTELRFSSEDLNRSVGPATARMGAGASLAILRSARQRVKESPPLQEVALKGEAVYVRADPAAAAAAVCQSVAGTPSGGGKASSTGFAEAADGTTGRLALLQPCELRDPYTGVVIPSSFAAAVEQGVPAVSLSWTTGIPFFHDPAAPRPVAVADVVQPLPLPLPPPATSDVSSLREAPLQNSFRAPLSPLTQTTTYTSLNSFQQLPSSDAAVRRGSANATLSQGGPLPMPSVPSRRFSLPLPLPTSVHAAAVVAAGQPADAATHHRDNNSTDVTMKNVSATPSDAGPYDDDLTGRHERTETETYRDVRLAVAHPENINSNVSNTFHSIRDTLLTCATPRINGSYPQQQESPMSVLSTGVYRMPSAIAGGSGQRQRWRLHSGKGTATAMSAASASSDGNAYPALGGNSSCPLPPWRWLHESLLPSTPFSTSSCISGGSRTGHRKTSGSGPSGSNNSGIEEPFEAPTYPNTSNVGVVVAATAKTITGTQLPTFNLCGFTNVREGNWAALRNATPSPRARAGHGSPYLFSVPPTAIPQLPLYPSTVAPYAAPRYPLQQNIRYNAWTADGVSASSGAACVVHVFTITREMLRSVYEYVACRCAQRWEDELREHERARQRRMRDALAAGVLTRNLQRCLRCPHCGTVGQIVKAAPSHNASPTPLQRPQPHPPTPRQLSQSVSVVREMSTSQHGCPSLRASASVSSSSMETQTHHQQQQQWLSYQPQMERGRNTLSSSKRKSPRKLNMPLPMPPLPHAARASSSLASSVTHPTLVHQQQQQQLQQQSINDTDAGINDTVVMELQQSTTHHGAAAATAAGDGAVVWLHATHPVSALAPIVAKDKSKTTAHEIEGSANTATASPPLLGVLPCLSSSLPPLPPSVHGAPHSRLLSLMQHTAQGNARDVTTSGTFTHSQLQQQQQHPPSSSATTSRFVSLGAATTNPPNVAASTPNKRGVSPTFTATTTTPDTSAEGNVENAMEKSYGSRDLSQSFAAPQPQRTFNSQPEFQLYATSSFNNSGPGLAMANGLLLSDSHCNLSHTNSQRASQEREEGSLCTGSRASDVAPYHSPHNNNGTDEEEVQHRSGALNHFPYSAARRSVVTLTQASCSSPPEGYMTPPTASLAQPGLRSPNQVGVTAGGNACGAVRADAAAAYAKRVLSPSTSSLPGVANTLPPLTTCGSNSPASSTPPSASLVRQITRPPQSIVASVGAGGCSRPGGNASFAGSAPTSVIPPLAPSSTSLPGDSGVCVNSNISLQSRDSIGESMNAAVDRGSLALARRYVCQSCHRDVVPKTSMVNPAQLEDRALSKSASEIVTPALVSGKTDNTANTYTRANDAFGVLAFEDLLQDDALVHALQTLLQESIMLPATRPPRPSPAFLTPAIPETTATAASVTATNPRFVISESAFSDVEGALETDLTSPTLPPVAHEASDFSGQKAKPSNADSIDASHVQLPSALCRSGEDAPPRGKNDDHIRPTPCNVDAMTTSAKRRWPRSTTSTTNSAAATVQVPMPSLAQLSKSSTSSGSPSSVASSARSKAAAAVPENDGVWEGDVKAASAVGEKHPVGRLRATTAATTGGATAPLLLRLCVPCCGLKVSVLDTVKSPAPVTPPLRLQRGKGGGGAEGKTLFASSNGAECPIPKTPELRRKPLRSNANDGKNGRRLSRKFSCLPLTIPRMREDAATRGLTQSALFTKKEPLAAAKCNGRESATVAPPTSQRGCSSKVAVSTNARHCLSNRRKGKQADLITSADGAFAANDLSQELNNSSKTVMQDTDASKRHRVQVNSRVHLDATSIDRIWERVFTQGRSSAVASVAAGRNKVRSKRLKSFIKATHTLPAKTKVTDTKAATFTAESPRAVDQQPAADAADGGALARTHQYLGLDLDAYHDASPVLKVELAYPRLPGGNVRQLLEEWVAACQPHPVLLEAVIRNIVYGVLTQLHTLHVAGYTSGNVKSTNVFPLWHLMKATKKAGIRMPPRAPAEEEKKRMCRDSKAGLDERLDMAASAFTRDVDAMHAVEHIRESVERGNNKLKSAFESGERSVQSRRPPELSPALVAIPPQQQDQWQSNCAAAKSLSQNTAAPQTVSNVSMSGIHGITVLAELTMPGRAKFEEQQAQQTAPVGTGYRRTSTKASQNTGAERALLDACGGCDLGTSNNNSDDAKSNNRRDWNAQEHPSSAKVFTVFSPTRVPPFKSTALEGEQEQQKQHEPQQQTSAVAPLTAAALSIPDALASHVGGGSSGSGSGIFSFSPAPDIASPTSCRRWRRFSIDDSVILTGSRHCSSSGLGQVGNRSSGSAGRRTHSAGPVNQRRRSSSTHSRSRDEEENLVPLLVELVVPSTIAPADDVGTLLKDELSTSQLPMWTTESTSSTTSCHRLQRRDDHQSVNNSPKFTVNCSAVPAEEAHVLRYVRGAQLIPPARVLLPSLRSCAGAGGEVIKGKDSKNHMRGPSKASSQLLPKTLAFGDSCDSDNDNDNIKNNKSNTNISARDEMHSLLTSGPTGAVPRPKSRRYSHAGSTSTKANTTGRGPKNETDPEGVGGSGSSGDALDPLQWSQQVMLVDNLGMRVETALRLAMTTVLTRHPAYPIRAMRAKPGSREEKASIEWASETPLLPRRTKKQHQQHQQQQRKADVAQADEKNESSRRTGPPCDRTTPASAFVKAHPGLGGGKTPLNTYVPDLSHSAPPTPPVLFGIQESEYVPAPETIRSAGDEAKALWCLWRQQQQQQQLQQGPLFSSSTTRRSSGNSEGNADNSEKAQMAYVVGQLSEQASPAMTLRNTLDPYPCHLAAVDIWQLGMLALDLADGPVPTTCLKQREPTPRLNPYPWSSYFQSFVSRCLQIEPGRRATTTELLRHPWFRVALVPQMMGGGGERSLRDNRLHLFTGNVALPLQTGLSPRMSCVMGVDCLTAEEQAEWEDFDYTLLYANGGGVPPLSAPPASLVSSVMNGTSRPRPASASSPSIVATAAGAERTSGAHTINGSAVSGLDAMSTGVNGTGISQSLVTSGGLNNNSVNLPAASPARIGTPASNVNNSSNTNNGSINAAVAGTVDTEFPAMSSVDLVQYFTHLAALQWSRQRQQCTVPSLGTSYLPGAGTSQGNNGSATDAGRSATPDGRGMSTNNLLVNSFFESTLPISAEDVLAVLRQTSSSTSVRYQHLGSPRQNLYNIVSPRPPHSAAAAAAVLSGVSQAQQTENGLPTPLLWGHPFGASFSGATYGLPSALKASSAASGSVSPSPPALSASCARPPSCGVNVNVGLPASYIPLRDPRVGGGNACNAAGTFASQLHNTVTTGGASSAVMGGAKSSSLFSPLWVNVMGESSPGATSINIPLYPMSARDTVRRSIARAATIPALAAAGEDRRYVDKCDPHRSDFSDGDRPSDRQNGSGSGSDVSRSSSNTYGSSDSDNDSDNNHENCRMSFGGRYSGSNSSSFMSSLNDSHLTDRCGGEVPYRRSAVVPHDDADQSAAECYGHITRNTQAPLSMSTFVSPFLLESVDSAVVGAAERGGHDGGKPYRRVNLGESNSAVEGRRSCGRRPTLRHRPHHLLGTLTASLARLSNAVASTSDSDEDDRSSNSVNFVTEVGGSSNDRSGSSFPDSVRSGRRPTQNFCDFVWEGFPLHASNPITVDAEQRVSGRGDHTACTRSAFVPLSSLSPHTHIHSEGIRSSSGDSGCGGSSGSSDDDDDTNSESNIEAQCDEIMRCFSELQRMCPMAVSLWCLRVLQQAMVHPRTAAAASRLMARIECRVPGGEERGSLAWLSAKSTVPNPSPTTTTTRPRNNEEGGTAFSTLSTAAATAAGPTASEAFSTPLLQRTPPLGLDTSPTNFHNYELAKWLYAAHQAIPRCV